MSRLPNVGGDDNTWGSVLNDFLGVEHNPDGSQKTLPVSKGGTGATDAATARSNIGAIARIQDATDVAVSSPAQGDTLSYDTTSGKFKNANGGVLPVFNVKQLYGAKGDGVTDDTAAIQNAITAAGAAGGGMVFLPQGTYSISNALDFSSVTKVALVGAEGLSVSYPSATTIRASASFPGNTPMLKFAPASNVDSQAIVRDLYLDCNSKAQDGVYLNATGGVYCRRMVVRAPTRDGFHVGGGSTSVSHFECIDCYVNNPANAAYYIEDIFCNLVRCMCDGGLYGVYASVAAGDLEITGGHFEGCTTAGIYMTGYAGTARIHDNLIQMPLATGAAQGIQIASINATGSMISGNHINGPTGQAGSIGIQASAVGTKIIGNEIGGWDFGILIGNRGCLVVGNRSSGAGTNGIKNDAVAGNASIIVGNIVTGPAVSVAFVSGGDVIYGWNRCDGTEPTGGKIGFFGATPVLQPSAAGSATGYAAGTTAATFHSDDTYTGNVGTTAYTINGIVAALKNLGVIKS